MDSGLLVSVIVIMVGIIVWDVLQKLPKPVTLSGLSSYPSRYRYKSVRTSGYAEYVGSFDLSGWEKDNHGNRIHYRQQCLVYVLYPYLHIPGQPLQSWSRALIYSNKPLDTQTEIRVAGVWQRQYGSVCVEQSNAPSKTTFVTGCDSGYVLIVES